MSADPITATDSNTTRRVLPPPLLRPATAQPADHAISDSFPDVVGMERGDERYQAALRKLGEDLRAQNAANALSGASPQKISVPYLKHSVGVAFYHKFADTPELRRQLLGELHALGYMEIELSEQKQNRGSVRKLSNFEHRIAVQIIGEMKLDAEGGQINIAECCRRVHSALNVTHGEFSNERSPQSVRYHVERILGVEHHITFERGSPNSGGYEGVTQVLSAGLKALDSGLRESPHADAARVLIEPDPQNIRRELYLRSASFGHQALLAYLLVPENYQRLFGNDAVLIAADFRESDTPADLFNAFTGDVGAIQGRDADHLAQFVDGWLRCDMLIWSPAAGYIVVEVKQNAVNTEQFRNADKAAEQLSAYGAVVRTRIDVENAKRSEDKLDGRVTGSLVAFNIAPELTDLLRSGGKRAIKLDRDEVIAYVMRAIAKSMNQPEETPEAPPAAPSSVATAASEPEVTEREAVSFIETLRTQQCDLFSAGVPLEERILAALDLITGDVKRIHDRAKRAEAHT